MSRIVRLYLTALKSHPYKTQACSTGILMATGDCIAQFAVEKRSFAQYDGRRSTRFLIFGTVLLGPLLRTWYLTIDKIVRTAPSGLTTLKKVALDQTCFAPLVLTFVLATLTFWKEPDVNIVKEKLKQAYIPMLITNYKIWPAAQLINFYFVPFQHRILYTNVIALFWNTYLAYMTEQPTGSEHVDSADKDTPA